jgi:hypothetical protein
MVENARNDLTAAAPKFSLALEEHRRTPDGRVRSSQELLATFFPHDEKVCTDKVFKYLPREVRGPILASWGIRGGKAALRDDDAKVQQVVHDALVAGDVDHAAFEDGLSAETLVRWVPLGELWAFWRGGKLTKPALHKALSTAYELYLFDARWFLANLQAKGGSLKGTDVLTDGLTKEELTQWIRRIHEAGDGSPKGLVTALGWDRIVAKTSNDVLAAVLDAMATKAGLGPTAQASNQAAAAQASNQAAATQASNQAAATQASNHAAAAQASYEAPAVQASYEEELIAGPEGAGDLELVVDDDIATPERDAAPQAHSEAHRIVSARPHIDADEQETIIQKAPRRSERPSARPRR